MSLDSNETPRQIKSRRRVQDHGEVFTNPREVNAMLDLVKEETERIDSRFLEPACGDSNFLAEILRRKLSVCADFLDFCLERMTAVDEQLGVQSLCMKLAYRMCRFYPELEGELLRTLQAMEIDYYTPAVRSVRSRILKGKMV